MSNAYSLRIPAAAGTEVAQSYLNCIVLIIMIEQDNQTVLRRKSSITWEV